MSFREVVTARGALGGILSILLHLTMLLALFVEFAARPYGVGGTDQAGEGIQVSLVSGFAAGAPSVGNPAASQAALEASATMPTGYEDTAPDAPPVTTVSELELAAGPRSQAKPQARSAFAQGTGGSAARADSGAASAKSTAGGDPAGSSDLLRQIARCLPSDFRPTLAFSQISLVFGDKGELRAAPEVSSVLPRLTAGDRLAADRIVQAALQCGPYKGAAATAVSLPADFSAIRPGFGGLDDGRADARTSIR